MVVAGRVPGSGDDEHAVRGRVVNLEPAIGAAFVDFGQGRNGFLHTSDVLSVYGEKDFTLRARKVSEDELKVIDTEVKAIVAAAAEFARASPEPEPAELYTDVYLEAAQ